MKDILLSLLGLIWVAGWVLLAFYANGNTFGCFMGSLPGVFLFSLPVLREMN